MFRFSRRSSSGCTLFTSLSMLLILKIIKIFKKYYQSIVVMWQHMFSMSVMRTVWRRELESSCMEYGVPSITMLNLFSPVDYQVVVIN